MPKENAVLKSLTTLSDDLSGSRGQGPNGGDLRAGRLSARLPESVRLHLGSPRVPAGSCQELRVSPARPSIISLDTWRKRSSQAGGAVVRPLPERPSMATPGLGTAPPPEEGTQKRRLGTEPYLMGAVELALRTEPPGDCSGDSDPTRRASVPRNVISVTRRARV